VRDFRQQLAYDCFYQWKRGITFNLSSPARPPSILVHNNSSMHVVSNSNMQGIRNSSGSSSMQRAAAPAMAKEVAGKCNSSIQRQQQQQHANVSASQATVHAVLTAHQFFQPCTVPDNSINQHTAYNLQQQLQQQCTILIKLATATYNTSTHHATYNNHSVQQLQHTKPHTARST